MPASPQHTQAIASPERPSGDAALKGRFAPSPTGRMHAGNIFAALVSWLLAKRAGGGIVLRIEDLDESRSRAEYASQLMRDFEALGLYWDEGPFYQHDRKQAYQQAFCKLREQNLLYPCYCTRASLHAASAPHAGEKPIYAGTCRKLSPKALREKARQAREQGREASFRLLVPDAEYALCDYFQGPYSQNLQRDCGDFVLRRSDGSFAYQLAVVLDDAEQGVNCVCRGVDLLSSTPQQMYLQQLLDLPGPAWAHIPLLMGPDGHRLSKRHASANIEALLARFESPQALLGHIAHIAGMVPEDAPFSCEELLKYADLQALQGKGQIAWR